MKPEVTLKYLAYLRQKKQQNKEGFTLIELLVVVIIIGVLAAVALPNLLGQVGKARESEGKNGVGSINRAQQAYHFERQTFAHNVSVTSATNALGVVIKTQYYSTWNVNGTSDTATVSATANQATKDGVRNYAGGIAFKDGAYDSSICQSDNIGGNATALAVNGTASCSAGAELK